ncbi:MAG: hypothetical protein KF892_23695 [Rhizobacter sp.]|nr:hypothetical protein [Rhizobacter sp.]
MQMDWHEHFSGWFEATGRPGPTAHLRLAAARKRVQTNTPADWQWLSDALADPARKVFVALVFKLQPVPKRLLTPFLHAAVLERNPSRNRIFVEPCVRSWGGREINRRLLRHLQNGSNEEKAGAASAFYWAQGNPRCEDLSQLRSSIRSALLREFVSNEDVSVRQRIVPLLRLDVSAYPVEEHSLIAEAIALARAHPDEYIRHRIEVQLGAGGPFKPIPGARPHGA